MLHFATVNSRYKSAILIHLGEMKQTIENTIDRDCKTGGGDIGFSVSFPATQRWVLHASRRAKYRQLIREHLAMKSKGYVHKELAASRIKKDKTAVEKVQDVLDNDIAKSWNGGDLQNLSTEIVASDTIKENLLNVRKYGQLAFKNFIDNRCLTSQKKIFTIHCKRQTYRHSKT